MLSREGKQTDRGAVGAEFIGYNRRRREALLLQEFPHQPNCRPSVPAGLNQEIQDFALTVHGTPEIELPNSNYDDHLVQVPAFGRSWPPTLNPPRIGPTEFQDPSSNCLIRDVETTLGKQVLNVPIAQRETAIEPDGMLDDDRWKAVTTVGYLAHPETLKHRPCRSHAVNVTMPLDALAFGIERRKVSWIVDADLRAYFDTIPRDWLITFLEHRIGDRRVIRLIRKWLNAGVIESGSWADTGMGTPQGAIVSPVLANVFLHYVLDLWFHKKWRPNVPDGEAIIVRYADDIVAGFQHKRDAERYLRDVRERLARFGLSLHQDKTRLVEFGRFADLNRRQLRTAAQ